MGARLSKDERRAVAQHIFAALCAHYPDRYVALFERPQVGASSPERVLTSGAAYLCRMHITAPTMHYANRLPCLPRAHRARFR